MLITAHQKYRKLSPQKTRQVAAAIRSLPILEAQDQLKFMPQRPAKALLQVLNQAVANATNNFQAKLEDLQIDTIDIQEGPTYKRWQPVSRGRAHPILKRTCHIKITLKGGLNGPKS